MSRPFALRAARTPNGYRLRVEGRATLRGRPALLELFVVQLLDRTPCSVVVDLTECEHLDERFLDALFDLERHYGHAGSGRFALLTRLGAPPAAETDRCDEVELPALEPGATDLEAHLMGWHRLLARLAYAHGPSPGREAAAALACV
jgi:hypothetical protein